MFGIETEAADIYGGTINHEGYCTSKKYNLHIIDRVGVVSGGSGRIQR